jgi:RNA polymerase sigma-70 factor, ECF subfamily
MTEYHELSQIELAVRLNLSISGAKSRVQRAREKLKEAFLDCCHFEFDQLGRVIHYEPKCSYCASSLANCSEDCG